MCKCIPEIDDRTEVEWSQGFRPLVLYVYRAFDDDEYVSRCVSVLGPTKFYSAARERFGRGLLERKASSSTVNKPQHCVRLNEDMSRIRPALIQGGGGGVGGNGVVRGQT